jgi:hypothetical protein
MDAVSALEEVCPAAPASSAGWRLERGDSEQLPDEAQWAERMASVNGRLKSMSRGVVGGASSTLKIRPDAAREEYMLNGQEGLDGLLAALDPGGSGFQALASINEQAGLTKVVLARRTNLAVEGNLDPLELLAALQVGMEQLQGVHGTRRGQACRQICQVVACQSRGCSPWEQSVALFETFRTPSPLPSLTNPACLQERDPRAYQLLLQMPSGATFLGSTPECLYARSGRAVASEAVAGTRARGAAGKCSAVHLTCRRHRQHLHSLEWDTGTFLDVHTAVLHCFSAMAVSVHACAPSGFHRCCR